jgi:hypothetical protein
MFVEEFDQEILFSNNIWICNLFIFYRTLLGIIVTSRYSFHIDFSILASQRRHIWKRREIAAKYEESAFFQRHTAKINSSHRTGCRATMSCKKLRKQNCEFHKRLRICIRVLLKVIDLDCNLHVILYAYARNINPFAVGKSCLFISIFIRFRI